MREQRHDDGSGFVIRSEKDDIWERITRKLEEYGRQAVFAHIEKREIMKGKGFVVIYTK